VKIISLIGARPQFIKAAMISKKLRKKGIEEILVHSGQHYDFNMSDIFFKELNLPKPDYHLGVGSGSHGEQTGKMLIAIEKVLLKEKPDWVLVYGDTNTTLAGALASAKLHIPVAHIEAGLRSYNKKMPEEINRVLTDHISQILFCPTETAGKNLKKEGFTNIVNGGNLIANDFYSDSSSSELRLTAYDFPLVINVGDVMLDIALEVKNKVDGKGILKRYSLRSKDYILVTIHRQENTDDYKNLKNICEALIELANQKLTIFFPVHPRTKKALDKFKLIDNIPDNLILTEPVSYMEMIALEKNARAIITDSGGVQKEGYFFKVPCIIPRQETEWVELVDAAWNIVTGTNKDRIVEAVTASLSRDTKRWIDFYGGGRASEKIVDILHHQKKEECTK